MIATLLLTLIIVWLVLGLVVFMAATKELWASVSPVPRGIKHKLPLMVRIRTLLAAPIIFVVGVWASYQEDSDVSLKDLLSLLREFKAIIWLGRSPYADE